MLSGRGLGWLARWPRVSAWLCVGLGSMVLTGWASGSPSLTRIAPGLVAMNPMTAVLFLLAGASLRLQIEAPAPSTRTVGRVAAALVVAVAAAKLAGYLLDWDVGVDRWLFPSRLETGDGPPNRMAPNTALGFTLAGTALLLLDIRWPRGWLASDLPAGLCLLTALLAATGYAYQVDELTGLAGYIPMAVHTAAGLLVLSTGTFAARPGHGAMAILASPTTGGALARRLLPSLVLTLLVVGWLRLEGERQGLYSTGLGVALYTMASIVVLTVLVWRAAHSLHRADAERAALAERQRESEARTRAIIDSASDAFIAIDDAGIVIGWNAQAETMFGWPRAHAVGGRLSAMILPPQHRQAHEDGLRRFAATGEGPVLNKRIEITALRRTGDEFPIELAIWPVWAQGQCTFNAFVRDIGERKRTEQIQARFAAIVASSDDAILSHTLDGTITSWNPGAERMFGYRADEAIGQPAAMLLPPERGSEETAILARIGQGERIDHFETVRVTADGARIDVEATVSPLRDPTGTVVGASTIARDITRRKQADARIHALNQELADNAAQLQQSNRELEAFSYTVSHDLRAPLRHIDGYARMLQEDAGEQLDADLRRYLDSIGDAARQMGALIDDLLAFSRLGRKPVERVEVDMHALVAQAANELGAGPRLHLQPLPAVQADPVLLRQVWINLLSNALKYSAPRGDEARIVVSGERVNGVARYVVRDNGVGFDMRYADKLFGVFQRLHSNDEFEGTGVGLAIVQRIVVRHGGTIEAVAAPGQGATFTLHLPVGEDACVSRSGVTPVPASQEPE